VGEIDRVQAAVNENVLDRVLALRPPGPMASMRVSYRTPDVRGVGSSDTKSRRIIPSLPGVGFPRSIVCTGDAPPARKSSSE
jgi:hypothetical protein